MGQKADYFCFDWTFFCKVSGFLGRFNVRYHSNVTHWFLLHLLLPFFFFNNKFNLAPRSLVFFWRFQQEIWNEINEDAHITVTPPFEQLGPHRLNHRKLLLTTVHERDDFSESNTDGSEEQIRVLAMGVERLTFWLLVLIL